MPRQIQAPVRFEGERVTNDDIAKWDEPFYVTNCQLIDTQFGPSYVFQLEYQDQKYLTFMAPGIKQRDEIASMFKDSDEPVGPMVLTKVPTKSGRNTWVFEPASEGF